MNIGNNNNNRITGIITPKIIAEGCGGAEKLGEDHYKAICPCHEDTAPSLDIDKKNGKILVHCRVGSQTTCKKGALIKKLRDMGLWQQTVASTVKRVTAEYLYIDDTGKVLFVKRRIESEAGNKSFIAGSYDSEGVWTNGKPRCVPVLYNLPKLIDNPDDIVFIVEGEKDCDNLSLIGAVGITNFDGAGKWEDSYNEWLVGRNVVIVPDNDRAGREHMNLVGGDILAVCKRLRVLEIEGLGDKGDISDWINNGGELATLLSMVESDAREFSSIGNWEDRLIVNDRGGIEKVLSNVALVLEHADGLGGLLKYNEFRQKTEVCNSAAWRHDGLESMITERDSLYMTKMVNGLGLLASKSLVDQGIDLVASDYTYDPLKDYLNGLVWDGVPRVDSWLTRVGAESEVGYCSRVGAVWMIGAVARGLRGGSKVDTILILEGGQGIRKSTLAKALCPDEDYFSDSVEGDLADPNIVIAIQGKWIVEMPELNSFSKSQVSQQKAFLSRTHDSVRLAYARHQSTFPRRCVFIGTHNVEEEGYLRDSTGSRRILPVSMGDGDIDVDYVTTHRDMLWAESVYRYKAGEKWWLEGDDAKVALGEQTARYVDHEIIFEVLHYLKHIPIDKGGIVEWVKRDGVLTVFFPKVFWEDLKGEDYAVTCPKHIKDGIGRGLRIRGFKKGRFYCKGTKRTESGWRFESGNGKNFSSPFDVDFRGREGIGDSGTQSQEVVGGGVRVKNGLPPSEARSEGVLRREKGSAEVNKDGVCSPISSISPLKREKSIDIEIIGNIGNTYKGYIGVIEVVGNLGGEEGSEEVLFGGSVRGELSPLSPMESSDLFSFIKEFVSQGIIGLDFETTGLSGDWASGGRVRLMQLGFGNEVLVVDLGVSGALADFKDALSGGSYVAHNAVFESSWLLDAGIDVRVDDTMLAYSSYMGGHISLADMCRGVLGVEVSKEFQKSDWGSAELSSGQLEYAAVDAYLVGRLWDSVQGDLKAVRGGYELLLGCVGIVCEMQRVGIRFDASGHKSFIDRFCRGLSRAESYLRYKVGDAVENWGSTKQVDAWFSSEVAKLGREERRAVLKWDKTKTGRCRSYGAVAIEGAFAKGIIPKSLVKVMRAYAVRQKRKKMISSFGDNLLSHVYGGRVKGSLGIGRAVTGRMTSSSPNLQQFPNGKFRELLVSSEGCKLVVADYSQIEVRVLGEVSGESRIADAFRQGKDFHVATASAMFKIPESSVTSTQRKKAKSLTFALQYGSGMVALSKQLGVEVDEAEDYFDGWLEAYPKVREWRESVFELNYSGESIETSGGRRIGNTKRLIKPQLVNYPVQGSAGDVLYAALIEVWNRKGVNVNALSVVHDEIILECPTDEAESTAKMLEESMVAGYLRIYPDGDVTGLVDASIGDNWGECK